MKKFVGVILVFVLIGGIIPLPSLAIDEVQDEDVPFVEEVQDEDVPFVEEVQDEAVPFVEEVQDEDVPFVEEVQNEDIPFVEEAQDEAVPFVEEVQQDEAVPFIEEGMVKSASLEGVSPLNATVNNVASFQDLENAINKINANSNHAQAEVIRITQNILVPGSRVLSIRRPNVYLLAGAGHFRIQSSSSIVFMVQNNGGFTVSGGSEGGSLEFRGADNYGSAIMINPGGSAVVTDGASITNYPEAAVRVRSGGYFRLSGTARLYLNRAVFPNTGGGGVNVADGGVFEMLGGIIEWNTAARGGGVFVETGGIFRMFGGEIRNNYATVDGGGLFVPTNNLDNITILPTAFFSGNVAQNGKRIDNPLAEKYRHQINPGTVSVTNMGDYLVDGGSFAEINPHAFTNYDINTDAPRFWRVTHAVGEGQGSVIAKIAASGVLIPNEAFVPEGTEIIFIAEPASLLNSWDIGTRTVEADEDKGEIPFQFTTIGPNTPLLHTITAHTHAIAGFSEGVSVVKFTLSKEVTGEMANRSMEFEFTLTFCDSEKNPLPIGTQFHYFGDTLPDIKANAPADGTLTLDENGSAVLRLTHGQIIHIEDILTGNCIRVTESPDTNYQPAYTDSEYGSAGIFENDTGTLSLDTDRAIHFSNERIIVPNTGLDHGSTSAIFLLLVLTSLPVVVALALRTAFRYRKS